MKPTENQSHPIVTLPDPRQFAPVCPFRGLQLRTHPCKGCAGSVKRKVYACELFTACSLSEEPPPGGRSCLTCLERPAAKVALIRCVGEGVPLGENNVPNSDP